MRTDELIRSLEVRSDRAARQVAERVVTEAGRTAVRRHRAQRAVRGGVVAVVLVAMGAVGWQVLVRPDPGVQVITRPDASGPQMVEHNGVGLRVPEGWRTSGENLTPTVTEPAVVASFGTAPLVVGGGASCAQFPMAAVLAMADDDVFVSLHERQTVGEVGWGWEQRAPSLWDMNGEDRSEVVECSEWPEGFTARWVPHSKWGRVFYLLIVIGPGVSEERLDELAIAVDEIYTEPAYSERRSPEPPPWQAELAVRVDEREPRPLGQTGAIGHPVEIDGRRFLVGSVVAGNRRAVEIMDADHDGSSTPRCVRCPFHGWVTGTAGLHRTTTSAAWTPGGAWGVVRMPVARVEFTIDDRVLVSEVVAVPSDLEIGVWFVSDPDAADDQAPRRMSTRLFDSEGNEIR